MELIIGVAALIVALISVGIAFWQGSISKEQLRLARETEGRTERALENIQAVTAETRALSQAVKDSIEDRITKILDSRLAAEQQSQSTSAQMTTAFMQKLFDGMGKKPTDP